MRRSVTRPKMANAPQGSADQAGLIMSATQRWVIGLGYLALLMVLVMVQLVIGADILTLGALTAIALMTLIPLRFRIWCVADFLWICFSLYCGFLALAIKTWVGQPVESNLAAPADTSGYMLIGTISAALGYLVARSLVRPAAAPFGMTRLSAEPRFLGRFAVPLFVIGLGAQIAHSILRPRFEVGAGEAGGGFGGFGVLAFLLVLGLAFQTVRWRQRTSALAGWTLALMLFSLLIVAVLMNVKTIVFSGLSVVVAGMVATSGARIRPGQLILAALPLPILLFYVAPLIQVMRPQLRTFSVSEIVEVASSVLDEAGWDPAQLSQRAEDVAARYTFNYRANTSYLYPSTMNADRFALIMPTDQVVRQLPRLGTMGLDSVADVPEAYLPGFLYKKAGVASPDLIAWFYEIRARGSVARPVIGLIASCAALGGLAGVAFVPFLVVGLVLSLLNWLAGPLGRNAWALFILVSYAQKMGERELAGLLTIGAREIPLIIIVGLALSFINRYMMPSGRPRRMPVVPINRAAPGA